MIKTHLTIALEEQRGRLFLWVPVCLAFGIGIYFAIDFEPLMGLVQVLICVAILVSTMAYVDRRETYSIFICAIALVFIGFLLSVFRTHTVNEPVLGWRYYGPIEGIVVAIDRSNNNRPRVTLTKLDLGKISKPRTPKFVRVSLHSDHGLLHIKPGARIRIIGSLSPPSGPVEPGGFDFQKYAWFKQLGAVGYSRKPVHLIKPPNLNSYPLRLIDLRMRISNYIRSQIKGQTGAFATAIITGDRSAIDPAILENLRASNLAHLLAISGLHMGLLVTFVFGWVRYGLAVYPYVALHWPTKKIGAILALIAGFIYLQVSGSAVATERAYIMVSVMLIGVLLDRPAITLRAVALAATLLLVMRPESLLQAGFQMSFAATTALVASFEYLKHQRHWQSLHFGRGRYVQPFVTLFISSLIAGMATAPFAAFHFNQVAHYGLLANLFSVPIMGMIVMPAAVLAGLLSPIGLDGIALKIMGLGIDWILYVANYISRQGNAVTLISQGLGIVLPLIAFGAILFILWRGRFKWFGPIFCLIGFGYWISTSRPDVLVSDTGRLLGILQNGERSLNRDRGSGFAARVWLENDGDKVDQKTAALRYHHFEDMMVMSVKGIDLGYIWPKNTDQSDIESYCAKTDILISPNWKTDLTLSCVHISQNYLKYNGSVAIYVQAGQIAQIRTARQMSGARLWNSWWLQK